MKKYQIRLEGGALEHIEAEGFTVKDHMIHFHSGEVQRDVAIFPPTATIEIMAEDEVLPLPTSQP